MKLPDKFFERGLQRVAPAHGGKLGRPWEGVKRCTEAALLELEAQFHPIRFAAFHLLDLEPEAVPLALFLEVHQSDSQHDRFKRFVRRLTGGRNMDTGFAL